MKAMKWSRMHRDVYSYDHRAEQWVKVWCDLIDIDCTAPHELKRGTKFDYTVRSTAELENAEEEVFIQRHPMGCKPRYT